MTKFFTIFFTIFTVSSFSFAYNDVSIIEDKTPLDHINFTNNLNSASNTENGLALIGTNFDQFFLLGSRLWTVLSSFSGQLTVSNVTGVAALPPNVTKPSELSNWKVSDLYSSKVSIKGVFSNALRFSYTIAFSYDGQLNGTGQYLANVSFLPFNAECGFSWKCTVDIKFGEPINIGSQLSPIAALPLNVLIDLKGQLYSKTTTLHYMIYGNGKIELNGETVE